MTGYVSTRYYRAPEIMLTWQKYDVEVVSGVHEGVKGIDGVGVEGAWTEENFGTPSVRGEDVMVRVRERRPVKA